ncbi:MAG: CU044_2847 family protein [Methylomicrobium sp.]
MRKLVKVKMNDTEIWMETGDIAAETGPQRVSVESSMENTLEAAKELHASIRAYCTSLVQGFQAINSEQRPNKITAEFGLTLSGDSKFYVVNVAAEGSLKITAEWNME